MAKKSEKLPDPKVWRRCQHPECLSKPTPGEVYDPKKKTITIMNLSSYPEVCALFLENYCARHLPENRSKEYKELLENWLKEGNSFEGVNLYRAPLEYADLKQANYRGAFLNEANFYGAQLQGSSFINANLEGSILAGSNLKDSSFNEANLQNADLRYSILKGCEFTNADLQGAFLNGTTLDGVKHLTWQQIRGGVLWDGSILYWRDLDTVGEEREGNWEMAQDAYRRLKNYFQHEGRYSDANEAYYREKLMAKHLSFVKCFREYERWYNSGVATEFWQEDFFFMLKLKVKAFFSWLGLSIYHIFTGFGERWWWTVLWALGIVALFAVIYGIGHATGVFLFDFKPAMVPSIFQYFYLSVVTFATLGFGDITPLCWQAQIPVVVEVIFGYVFLGLIITIIARRFGR